MGGVWNRFQWAGCEIGSNGRGVKSVPNGRGVKSVPMGGVWNRFQWAGCEIGSNGAGCEIGSTWAGCEIGSNGRGVKSVPNGRGVKSVPWAGCEIGSRLRSKRGQSGSGIKTTRAQDSVHCCQTGGAGDKWNNINVWSRTIRWGEGSVVLIMADISQKKTPGRFKGIFRNAQPL